MGTNTVGTANILVSTIQTNDMRTKQKLLKNEKVKYFGEVKN